MLSLNEVVQKLQKCLRVTLFYQLFSFFLVRSAATNPIAVEAKKSFDLIKNTILSVSFRITEQPQ